MTSARQTPGTQIGAPQDLALHEIGFNHQDGDVLLLYALDKLMRRQQSLVSIQLS